LPGAAFDRTYHMQVGSAQRVLGKALTNVVDQHARSAEQVTVLLRFWLSQSVSSKAPSRKEIAALLRRLTAGDSDVKDGGKDTRVDDHEESETMSEGCSQSDEEHTRTKEDVLRANDGWNGSDLSFESSAANEAQAATAYVQPMQAALEHQTGLAAALGSGAAAKAGQYALGDAMDAGIRAMLQEVCQVDIRRHAVIRALRRLSRALVRSCAQALSHAIAV
jgi:hypothetical protein